MKPLKLRDVYSRRDIHGIFSPDTKFTPQAGTWGLQGIIKIPSRENDFVFIVTYGQSQGDHDFDEGITKDGVLSWQSQPSQDFQNKVIQQLITHDDLTSNIYLFLRENKKDDYKYYGKLAYFMVPPKCIILRQDIGYLKKTILTRMFPKENWDQALLAGLIWKN